MAQSLSWIENDDLSRALQRAGLGASRPSGLTGGAPASVVAPWAYGARPAMPVGPVAPVVPASAPASAAAPKPRSQPPEGAKLDFVPPEGRLERRLEAFMDWVIEHSESTRTFVVDNEGLVLTEMNADPDLIAISSSFMNLLQRVHQALESSTYGSISIDLESGQVLHLVQAQSILDSVVLGFVVSEPVDRSLIRAFRRGLNRTMGEDDLFD